jgi:hypothetical protein
MTTQGPTNTGRQTPQRILHITACAVQGDRRTFVNVYGLDDLGRVWQWNAKVGDWEPNMVRERAPAAQGRGFR